MVDHDADTFTLWQANPSHSEKLVPVVSESIAKGCTNNNVTAVVQPSTSTLVTPIINGTNLPPPVQQEQHHSSAGLIAGVVVGSVAALAAVAFGVFFVLRRRKRGSATQIMSEAGSFAEESNDNKRMSTLKSVYEVQASPRPYEVQGSNIQDGVHEMDGGIYGFASYNIQR